MTPTEKLCFQGETKAPRWWSNETQVGHDQSKVVRMKESLKLMNNNPSPQQVRLGQPRVQAHIARTYTQGVGDATLWHGRLMHAGATRARRAVPEGVKVPDTCFCDACCRARAHSFPFKPVENKVKRLPGEEMHSDGRGYFVRSFSGMRYRFLYTDGATGYIWFAPVRDRSDQPDAFARVKKDAQAITGRPLRVFRCDGAKEYMSAEFVNLLGFTPEYSGPHASQQNGRAEISNRIIDEGALAAMAHAGDMPVVFWAEAQACSTFVYNNAKFVETTPGSKRYTSRRALLGNHPEKTFDPTNFRTFGCLAYMYLPKQRRTGAYGNRLKATRGVFVGYCSNMRGYRIYDPRRRQVFDVPFQYAVCNETIFPYRDRSNWTKMERDLPPIWHIPGSEHAESYEDIVVRADDIDSDDDDPYKTASDLNRGVMRDYEASYHNTHRDHTPRRATRGVDYSETRPYKARPKNRSGDWDPDGHIGADPAYEVEAIVDARWATDEFQYRVKWKDYDGRSNTWVPAADLDAPQAIEDFYQKYPGAVRKEDGPGATVANVAEAPGNAWRACLRPPHALPHEDSPRH